MVVPHRGSVLLPGVRPGAPQRCSCHKGSSGKDVVRSGRRVAAATCRLIGLIETLYPTPFRQIRQTPWAHPPSHSIMCFPPEMRACRANVTRLRILDRRSSSQPRLPIRTPSRFSEQAAKKSTRPVGDRTRPGKGCVYSRGAMHVFHYYSSTEFLINRKEIRGFDPYLLSTPSVLMSRATRSMWGVQPGKRYPNSGSCSKRWDSLGT